MPITVRLESPVGTILDTPRVEPGQAVRITGTVKGSSGFPITGIQPVRMQLYDGFSPIQLESSTNPWGNYWFDITAPNVIAKATLAVATQWPITGWETTTLPIGIGVVPDVKPLPSSWLEKLVAFLPWLIIGYVAYLAVSKSKERNKP